MCLFYCKLKSAVMVRNLCTAKTQKAEKTKLIILLRLCNKICMHTVFYGCVPQKFSKIIKGSVKLFFCDSQKIEKILLHNLFFSITSRFF